MSKKTKIETPEVSPASPTESVRAEEIKKALALLGIPSFTLLYQPESGLKMFHIEHMQTGELVNLLIVCLTNTLQTMIIENPAHSEEYKNIFVHFEEDLKSAIKNHNERLGKLLKKSPLADAKSPVLPSNV